MGFLPDIFVDERLKARQDQLNGQWISLRQAFSVCDNTPDSAFAEISNNFKDWTEFYEGGNNWSINSKKATDEWQTKAQDWATKLRSWGCTGNFDNLSVVSATGDTQGGIPSIKDNPEDDKGILDTLTDTASALTKPARDAASTVGWVVVGVVVLALVLTAYVLTRGKASGFGLKVG